MSERLAEKRKAFDWFGLTREERFAQHLPFNRTELAKSLGIKTVSVIDGWYKEWEAYEADIDKTAEVIGEYNSDEHLANRTKQVDADLLKACERGSPSALQTFYKLTHRLIEESKQEVIHKLDGSYLAREILRARRELEDSGMAQVPDESRILPENLCLPSGQGENEDDKV